MKREMLISVRAMCFVQLAAFYLVTAAAQAQTFASRPASAAMPQAHMQKHIGGSDNIERSMVIGLECMQKMQMSGDTDKEFKTIMYEYHRQGVEMAQTQRAHGKSAAMKAMARKIISAQMKDIAQFNQRRDKQK